MHEHGAAAAPVYNADHVDEAICLVSEVEKASQEALRCLDQLIAVTSQKAA